MTFTEAHIKTTLGKQLASLNIYIIESPQQLINPQQYLHMSYGSYIHGDNSLVIPENNHYHHDGGYAILTTPTDLTWWKVDAWVVRL